MKKKIVAMALSAVLGLSMFGGVAQARAEQTASTQACSHTTLILDSRTFVRYDPASGNFHNIVYRVVYKCKEPSCNHTVSYYEYEYEDHTFYVRNEYGYWVCHYCGFVDDTQPYPN